MLSNITRGATFTAAICIISALLSTAALSAEPRDNSWYNPLSCANKDTFRTIGDLSSAAQKMMKGTPYSRGGVSYILSVAKSPGSRITAQVVTVFSNGLYLYDTWVCHK
jgi:hypothetical protein